jgi:methanesulfonate monooxygenase small subunit
MNAKELVQGVVYKSCIALDEKAFSDYLTLCDDAYDYKITATSPEIGRDMIWLQHDKQGMKTLFEQLPRHNSDHSPLTRHATIYSIDYDEDKAEAAVVTALQVFKTELDGGATELYAVGKMYDRVALRDGTARLLSRNIKLDTRQLGIGHHLPF